MSEQADLLAPPPAPVVLNTAYARDALQKRYAAPEWALLQEVAPATGGGTRYADAIAVNLWASRGHAIHGFEIKVSRSDWLRELKKPEKAEEIFQYCDFWWIVAPREVVKSGELPPTWGLLELRSNGLFQITAAPRLSPIPITKTFFASLMRRGHEQINAIAERMQLVAVVQAREAVDKRVDEEVKRRTRAHTELQREIERFKNATGIELTNFSGPPIRTIKLAQALEQLEGWRGEGALSRLTELAGELDKAANTVRDAIISCGLMEKEQPE